MKLLKMYAYRFWFMFLLSQGKLIEVDDRHRGVGKTTMMVNKAQKEGYVIVVGSQQQANLLKGINSSVKIFRVAKNFTFEVKGRGDTSVLIDESVDPEMINYIKQYTDLKIRGGFKQNYGK